MLFDPIPVLHFFGIILCGFELFEWGKSNNFFFLFLNDQIADFCIVIMRQIYEIPQNKNWDFDCFWSSIIIPKSKAFKRYCISSNGYIHFFFLQRNNHTQKENSVFFFSLFPKSLLRKKKNETFSSCNGGSKSSTDGFQWAQWSVREVAAGKAEVKDQSGEEEHKPRLGRRV